MMVSLIFTSNSLTKYDTKTAQISLVEKYVPKLKIKLKVKANQAQNQ